MAGESNVNWTGRVPQSSTHRRCDISGPSKKWLEGHMQRRRRDVSAEFGFALDFGEWKRCLWLFVYFGCKYLRRLLHHKLGLKGVNLLEVFACSAGPKHVLIDRLCTSDLPSTKPRLKWPHLVMIGIKHSRWVSQNFSNRHRFSSRYGSQWVPELSRIWERHRQQAASSHSRPFIAIHGQLSGRGAPKKFKVVVLGDEAAGAILWARRGSIWVDMVRYGHWMWLDMSRWQKRTAFFSEQFRSLGHTWAHLLLAEAKHRWCAATCTTPLKRGLRPL